MTLHLDLLLHNLVALCTAIVMLLLLSELVVRVIHRGYAFVLRSPTLEQVTADEQRRSGAASVVARSSRSRSSWPRSWAARPSPRIAGSAPSTW